MIWVLSQNKEILVECDNFSISNSLKVYSGIDCYVIDTEKEGYNFELGNYKTKEKALEVLKEIQNKILEYTQIVNGYGDVQGLYNIPKVFEMPQDNEVQ